MKARYTSGLTYPPEQIQRARRYAARPSLRYARSAEAGKIDFASHVTSSQIYSIIREHRVYAREILEGLHDHNFTVWQRMNYYLTGECPALLPK